MLLKLICRHVDCQAREAHKKLFMLLKLVGRRNATASTLTPLTLRAPPSAPATVHLMPSRERWGGGWRDVTQRKMSRRQQLKFKTI